MARTEGVAAVFFSAPFLARALAQRFLLHGGAAARVFPSLPWRHNGSLRSAPSRGDAATRRSSTETPVDEDDDGDPGDEKRGRVHGETCIVYFTSSASTSSEPWLVDEGRGAGTAPWSSLFYSPWEICNKTCVHVLRTSFFHHHHQHRLLLLLLLVVVS